ncbi:MAG: hypothetical protein RJA36_3298 [Pseudomonadota bacterium]|jgi:histidinol-phosphate aminotransferase
MAEARIHGGPDELGMPRHDFSTNSNACGSCPAALIAVQSADPARYPDPAYRALREALARWHGVEPARVLLAGSASEFIFRVSALAAQLVREAGSGRAARVSLPAHGYGDYAQAARSWGLEPAPAAAADLAWACDPSSPLGQPHPDLAAQARALQPGQMLVLDCAYRPLRLQGRLGLDQAGLDRVWQLWTPNKALGLTGVRAAYALAPRGAEFLVERLQALTPSWPVGAHGVAMLQAWTTPAVQDWLTASLQQLRSWKIRQVALCHELGWQVESSVANFFIARPDSAALAQDLARLRARDIKLRDAASFGLDGRVRLGVLAPESQDALARAWQAIRRTS